MKGTLTITGEGLRPQTYLLLQNVLRWRFSYPYLGTVNVYVWILLETGRNDLQSLIGLKMTLAKSGNKALPFTPRKPGSWKLGHVTGINEENLWTNYKMILLPVRKDKQLQFNLGFFCFCFLFLVFWCFFFFCKNPPCWNTVALFMCSFVQQWNYSLLLMAS